MNKNQRKTKHPSRYLLLSEAKKIITLANKYEKAGKIKYLYKVAKEMNISIKRVKRTLEKAFSHKIFKPRLNKQWKGAKLIKVYYLSVWKEEDKKRRKNKNKANFIKKSEEFNAFVSFIKEKYDSKFYFLTTKGIKRKHVRYSAEAYIDEFKKSYPNYFRPSKSAIYRAIESNSTNLKRIWFTRLYKMGWVKNAKKNFLKKRYQSYFQLPKIKPNELGHFQADSVIGKATDSKAIASLLEMNTGLVRLNLYDRSSIDFVTKITQDIKKHDSFKSLLVDNGSENSKLDLLLEKNKLYSCEPYSSWQKAEIESMHRLIRIFWPKGESMNSLTQSAVKLIERKVNLYFRKRYNKYTNYRYRLNSVI